MCRENLIDFDKYVIFEDGKVFSKHWNRFIDGTVNKDGYLRVCLKCKDNCNWGTRNERISKSHKGVKLGSPSEETRIKQSDAQKKRFQTNSPWNKGIKGCFSDETLIKMRKPHKKRCQL